MKFHHFGLTTAALLLIAAQDAPTPPAEGASFSEAFTEQSNAAKAEQAAEELDKPAAEQPAEAPVEPTEALTEPTSGPPADPEAKPAESVEAAQVALEPPSALAAAPDAAAKLAKGDPVTHDFLVGIWAEPGKSCEAGIDFQADGKMIGPFPRWELSDGELTMVGNRQKMRLTVVDQDTMQSRRSETDPPRTLKRCPKAPLPPKP